MLEERIESAQKPTDHDSKRGTTNLHLPAKIRSKSEVIHDTSDVLEAKETLETVQEVVRELPKTLEATRHENCSTRGRLVHEKFEKLCR